MTGLTVQPFRHTAPSPLVIAARAGFTVTMSPTWVATVLLLWASVPAPFWTLLLLAGSNAIPCAWARHVWRAHGLFKLGAIGAFVVGQAILIRTIPGAALVVALLLTALSALAFRPVSRAADCDWFEPVDHSDRWA